MTKLIIMCVTEGHILEGQYSEWFRVRSIRIENKLDYPKKQIRTDAQDKGGGRGRSITSGCEEGERGMANSVKGGKEHEEGRSS